DSYVVTQEFADEWDLETVEDLDKVTEPLTLGANSEAESRPNGPEGLAETYGIEVGFSPIEDSGGPLTVKALQDGDVQMRSSTRQILRLRPMIWYRSKTPRVCSYRPMWCLWPATKSMKKQHRLSMMSLLR